MATNPMKKLRFLHIPKTAGSTFSRILRNQYKGSPQFVFKGQRLLDQQRYSALSEQERARVVLFTGHAPLVTGIREADEAPTITILRDPVKRVKSFIQHVSEGKSPYLLDAYPPEQFDLDEFLESGNTELSNLQSRMLVNYEMSGDELVIGRMTPAGILEKALDNLFNRVVCYGLQEYFDQSLIRFSTVLGWKMPYYEYMNKRDTRHLLTFEDRHMEKIMVLNDIDIQFYNAARDRFVHFVESDPDYRRVYESFRIRQKLASPIMKVYGGTGRFVKAKYRDVFGGKIS